MKDDEKQIRDWQEHVRESFGDQSRLIQYLFETMDNFYYRYLETGSSKNLRTAELAPGKYGALSFETSMVEALKHPRPEARPGIIEMAKAHAKTGGASLRQGLWVEVKELTPDQGHLIITAEINWDFPDFSDASKRIQKKVRKPVEKE